MTDRDLMIEARGVEKWYPNGYHALRGVDLNVYRGEVVVIMGPSGSGKSTFIRTFNALEDFQGGEIVVDGMALSDDVRNIDAIRRGYPPDFAKETQKTLDAIRLIYKHDDGTYGDERLERLRTELRTKPGNRHQ